jgi:hypothetical protein
MSTSDFFLGPDRDLTNDEIKALTDIKAGVQISQQICHKLELENLVERRLGGWRLTQAGEFRLGAEK